MAGMVATWAVVVAAVGHADAARMLAATTCVRAILLLTKMSTSPALKRRVGAPREVRRHAKRLAFTVQATALATSMVLILLLVEVLKGIGQQQIAAYLPFIALGMPARYLRFADIRTSSPYNRLALAAGGLPFVLLGWGLGWQAAAMSFAFGARDWIVYAVLRLWPNSLRPMKVVVEERLNFAEVARDSVIVARRLLTYRLTKSLLTVFGPFGNAAARTGRGLNWHTKIEPYLPHHLGGFILFSAGLFGTGIFLALRSGEPAAMVGAAGLFQIGAAAANVVLLWRYLPTRKGVMVHDEDDEDE